MTAKKIKNLLTKLLALSLLILSLTACGTDQPSTATALSQTTSAAMQVTATTKTSTTPINSVSTINPTAKAPTASGVATNEPIQLRFSEFYAERTTPINLEFSQKLKEANGKMIKITGYMAPPLKPDLDFFVLTKIKLAVCPFCSTAAEWPADILLVTMSNGKTVPQIEEPISVIGKLEMGEAVDPETGFFSMLRLRSESVEVFKGS